MSLYVRKKGIKYDTALLKFKYSQFDIWFYRSILEYLAMYEISKYDTSISFITNVRTVKTLSRILYSCFLTS